MSSQPPSVSEAVALWFSEADIARRAGDIETAKASLAQVLAHDPAHADAMHAQGLIALMTEQFEDAQSWLERAIEARADGAFFGTLCGIQMKRGSYADALHTAQRGLALAPESTALLHYQASMLQALGRPDEAAQVCFRLLELDPDHPDALASLGLVLADLGTSSEAERYLRQVIASEPANLRARANLGQVLLAAGNYEEGWKYFEDRLANPLDAAGQPHPCRARLALPEWRGEPLRSAAPGRAERLLVVHEEGLGDSLQFVRYLPMALERFTQVGYICPQPLRRLYDESLCERWPGLVMIDDASADVSEWDYQCPLMSLPMAFGTRLDNIPTSPYLKADAARSASWRAKLDSLSPAADVPRAGIAWASGPGSSSADIAGSLTAAQIAPLLSLRRVRWISLQTSAADAVRAGPASGGLLTDWMHEVTDFADMAALIDNLDLVIAVDSSVAHLAATLGKPVWLLNRFAGGWRWLRDRDDSPWYPSLRIFTQPQRGDWNPLLARVTAALRKRFPLT